MPDGALPVDEEAASSRLPKHTRGTVIDPRPSRIRHSHGAPRRSRPAGFCGLCRAAHLRLTGGWWFQGEQSLLRRHELESSTRLVDVLPSGRCSLRCRSLRDARRSDDRPPIGCVRQAIDAITPTRASGWRGGTPTLAVLQGTYSFLHERAKDDASGKYAVVLVTDGYPQGCDDDEDDIANVADAVEGAAATLPTYVIGVRNPPGGPDTVSNLNRLAVAGGTEQAFLVATGDPETTARDFKAVIDSIRGETLSCEARIPENPGGLPVDPARVNSRSRAAHPSPASPTTSRAATTARRNSTTRRAPA